MKTRKANGPPFAFMFQRQISVGKTSAQLRRVLLMTGATSPQLQTEAEMIRAIREAGRTPVQRNTFYEPLKVFAESSQTANEAESRLVGSKSKVLEDNLATA